MQIDHGKSSLSGGRQWLRLNSNFETNLTFELLLRRDQRARPAGHDAAVVNRAVEYLDDALRPVASLTDTIVDAFKSVKAKEVAVELGVEIGAEAGVVFARASTTATLKITVTWQPSGGKEAKDSG